MSLFKTYIDCLPLCGVISDHVTTNCVSGHVMVRCWTLSQTADLARLVCVLCFALLQIKVTLLSGLKSNFLTVFFKFTAETLNLSTFYVAEK